MDQSEQNLLEDHLKHVVLPREIERLNSLNDFYYGLRERANDHVWYEYSQHPPDVDHDIDHNNRMIRLLEEYRLKLLNGYTTRQ